jgi:hypothetical protein
LGIVKSDLDEGACDVSRSECTWELIICLLDVLKNYFGEVNEAIFQGVERACVLILCIWGIEKSLSWNRLNYVLNTRMPWELIIRLLYVLKDDFDKVDETMFQGVDGPCELIFCIPGIEKSVFHDLA